jgi:hypothetical protein
MFWLSLVFCSSKDNELWNVFMNNFLKCYEFRRLWAFPEEIFPSYVCVCAMAQEGEESWADSDTCLFSAFSYVMSCDTSGLYQWGKHHQNWADTTVMPSHFQNSEQNKSLLFIRCKIPRVFCYSNGKLTNTYTLSEILNNRKFTSEKASARSEVLWRFLLILSSKFSLIFFIF